MSNGDGGNDGNRTVFRPSPLQGLRGGQQPQPGGNADWAAPPSPAGFGSPPPADPFASAGGSSGGYDAPPPLSRTGQGQQAVRLDPSRLAEDDVPRPAKQREVRNVMLTEAAPVLALAAGIRSGRVRAPLPQFHREATQLIASFDRAIAPHYREEVRQRAKYAVCATIDDIAQNLPNIGTDGAEWARRSMVVQFFQENIGGDRFWQLTDDMLRAPSDNLDIIELYHACLAAGFEGRFRVMPDGKRRLHEIMARLQGALDHVRALSPTELSRQWKGEAAPLRRMGLWNLLALAAAGAAALLLLVYIVLRLLLMTSAEPPATALAGIAPGEPLTLSRPAAALPAGDSAQASKLKKFLEPEIREGLVTVEEDAQTVRVRTTVGQLFQSGSDALEEGREPLFRRIGAAIEEEQGSVLIEGHADSDRVASLTFPDNMALSEARAETVGKIIRATLSDASRVTTKGMGETVPLASNDTAAGKSKNRRVEIIVPRRY
ncbi:type VI secretion system protein TssL, long form [Sphingomonas sp. S2-65]|uniref:type VI secretion system protein TssL, long form n=1 Tax=Sphingomonas sp. S2-65 TaxID=2903960 RepID=UPI001F185E40|nr:type VI secretion system protein TssL, long form [Sphingomonas sp. S2-65]UYY57205.1 type VI secretion system protein TssL, long form [Sphingomonas sp. S2-65]